MQHPSLDIELALLSQGYAFIAGLDEAGRGAWAGPVVAAAVVLPLDRADLSQALDGVRDSKTLTPGCRERMFERIQEVALDIGVGVVAPQVIDQIGIVPATRQAMTRAIARLSVATPDHLILDHIRLPEVELPQYSVPHADAQMLTVAAASIIAKVTRDRIMTLLEITHPGYEFARHKGYGTAIHRAALERLGPASVHRMSFSPLQDLS